VRIEDVVAAGDVAVLLDVLERHPGLLNAEDSSWKAGKKQSVPDARLRQEEDDEENEEELLDLEERRGAMNVTPLLLAIELKQREIASLLIQKGADADAVDVNMGENALMKAAKGNLPEIAQMLVDATSNLDAVSHEPGKQGGRSALILCCENLLQDVAILIISSQRANLNLQANDGTTALHACAKTGLTVVAQMLIVESADLEIRNFDDETPLEIALERGHLDIAKILLQAGAGVSYRGSGPSVLHSAAALCDLSLVKSIVKKGGEDLVNSRSRNNMTALHIIARQTKHDCTQALLCARELIIGGVDVDVVGGPKKWPAVKYAKASKQSELHDLLKYSASDIGKTLRMKVGVSGATLLVFYDSQVKSTKSLRKLDASKLTALGITSVEEKRKLVAYFNPIRPLIMSGNVAKTKSALGKDPKAISSLVGANGETPLNLAVILDKAEIVAMLLNLEGIRVNSRDGNQMTPVHHACRAGNLTIFFMLYEAEAATNMEDHSGMLPCHHVCTSSEKQQTRITILMQLAEKHGRSILKATTKDGKTPLNFAESCGATEIVSFLQK